MRLCRPAAVVLGCLDSRVPVEVVFDAGIGDTFTGRVAGNVINDDMLGSMEFGCAASGAKVVVVLGHTACGAVKGAIDDVVLGNPTGCWRESNRRYQPRNLTPTGRARMRVTLMLLRELHSAALCRLGYR
jgi:carbonic anhydrase